MNFGDLVPAPDFLEFALRGACVPNGLLGNWIVTLEGATKKGGEASAASNHHNDCMIGSFGAGLFSTGIDILQRLDTGEPRGSMLALYRD